MGKECVAKKGVCVLFDQQCLVDEQFDGYNVQEENIFLFMMTIEKKRIGIWKSNLFFEEMKMTLIESIQQTLLK